MAARYVVAGHRQESSVDQVVVRATEAVLLDFSGDVAEIRGMDPALGSMNRVEDVICLESLAGGVDPLEDLAQDGLVARLDEVSGDLVLADPFTEMDCLRSKLGGRIGFEEPQQQLLGVEHDREGKVLAASLPGLGRNELFRLELEE